MVQEERLKNWAWYCAWGHLGPEVRTRAASAEGNYESDDVFEGEEPRLEPDMIDGEIIEQAVRKLPEKYRKVLKARFIMYPYHLQHTVAQRLRMSVDRLESELQNAKRRLTNELERDRARHSRMAESQVGVCDSITSK
jgi:DNA-directed RNA polymerase specialized sigma24 family protein